MGSATIPRAHILADIAAEEVMADSFPGVLCDFATQLDGRVGHAFPAVENVWFEDGAGRTRVNAPRAGAATIGNRRIVAEFNIGDDATQEEP